ncbi:MAG: heat shock protein HspQ [Myxococcales bacterium]|nr:heat shock protein HspQ [Myxococcales bacterium]
MEERGAKFRIGQVVRHRFHPFRGVVFDVDPTFSNSEEWWNSIPPAQRPHKDQPYYHLLAENSQNTYVAYVSEQNLLRDETGDPVRHPQVEEIFGTLQGDRYELRAHRQH